MMGKERRAIAEGYVPETSHGPEPEMTNHETVCMPDAGDGDGNVRTGHVRFDDLDVSMVCQRTRLDSRQAENALLTTIPYGAE